MPTILYIDDDEDSVLFVLRALEARGYEAVWAVDGREGLAMARACQPDVILLDMELSEMNSYEVVRQLRADSRHPLFSVPVIALTSCSLPGAALDVLAAGCDVCMVRPVSLQELWAEVAEALQRERQPGGYPLSQMRSLAREVLQTGEV
jgi:two-component system, cell cycle response regulator DivK